jgi:spore coat polysaccharide biosynthesis protein SpsF
MKRGGHTVGILQARVGSNRLPGKVLLPVLGQPLLAVLLDRLHPTQEVQNWVVATTDLAQDEPIQNLASAMGFGCYRGHPEDCLDRYYHAAREHGADHIVRLTADNPLVEAGLVDWVVDQYQQSLPDCDYASTGLSHTFPLGLSVEAFSFAALAAAWREDQSANREHVTPFLYLHPERFKIKALRADHSWSQLRWTVDTPEDLEFIRSVFDYFGRTRFTWRQALDAVLAHTEWSAKNRHVVQRTI